MLRKLVIPVGLAVLAAACAEEPRTVVRHTRPDVVLPSEIHTINARVPRNATLDSLLRAHHLSSDLIKATVAAARNVFNPRDLRADRPYTLVRSIDGALREFQYEIDADRILRIINPDLDKPARLEATVEPIEKEISIDAIGATIDSLRPSLISAVSSAGETIQLALALADVFSGTIDFESDLQPGDNFELVFEKSTRDGEFASYGPILAARFVADGREHQAFRWTDPATGKSDYYDSEGRSLKRFFLKSPLKFEVRVTSGFSRRRFHPVHRTFRPHLGVDYGAPRGAPVVAVADGVVVSAGWAGGGGNQVRIRHAGGYESYYLHLSAFGSGVRAGARVAQGQVIGRVGATGTATGPHLDYRIKRNGVFVNPRVEHAKLPPGEPITAAHLPAFRQLRDAALERMTTVLAESARNRPDAVRAQ
jgi:murein DD-endopeptidase MepM/ murein hydrolase activator NlpD